jgi:tape measure domain-containing protein
MTDYKIRIIVDGQDNASGPLGKVGSALGQMGTIAGGILSAQLLKNIAGGVIGLGRAAVDSYASYERLGMSLQSMVAREMSNASTVTHSTTVTREATQAEKDRAAWLLKEIDAARKHTGEVEAGSDAAIKAQKTLANLRAQYQALGVSAEGYVTNTSSSTEKTLSIADAMGEAGGRAKELQDWITKLAIKSPFTQSGVAEAFRMAMAYGFTTDEAQRLTGAMIDFSSATGQDESSMARIALALGQIKAKGKVAGQEVLQLTEAGLSVDAILAKAFNKSTAEIVAMREKGLIPADQAIEAITKSLEEDFGGAAEKQANTFSGLLSSLSDIKEVGLREFFTGTFQAVQPYLINFVNWITDPKIMSSIRGWGDKLGKFVAKFAKLGEQTVNFISKGNFKGAINNMLNAIFGPQAIDNAGGAITGFIGNMIGKMLTGLVTNQPKMLTFAMQLLNGITGAIVAALPALVPMVTQLLTVLIIFLQQTLPLLIPAGLQILIALANAILQALPTLIPVALNMLTTLALGIAQAIPQLIPAVVQIIPTVVQILVNNLPLLVSAALQVLLALANGLITSLPVLIAAIPQIVSTLVNTIIILAPQLLQSAVTLIATLVTGLINNLPQIGAAAGNIVETVVNGIAQLWNRLVDVGGQIIQGVWQGIQNNAAKFWNDVTGFFSGIVDGVKRALHINSPSKVFAGIGMSMMEGLAQGINKGSVMPNVALNSVTKGLVGAGANGGAFTDARSWNLNLTTSQSPNVVQSSFEILRVLQYGS